MRTGLLSDSSEDQVKTLNYFNLINNTIASATNRLAQTIIEKYPPGILIEISRDSAGIFDFFKAEELVEIGRYAAIKKLDSIK
jgi:NTE family protein